LYRVLRSDHVLGSGESWPPDGVYRHLTFLYLVRFPVFSVSFAQGLNPGATSVFRYISFLFLAMYAAESQVLLVAAICPIFVAALAINAFLMGFLMSVQVRFHLLNVW
jgi:hypothetical protein